MPVEYIREKVKTKTLKEVLLHELLADTYVRIVRSGWYVGFTYIDYEDHFIHSLASDLLSQKVESVKKVSDPAFNGLIWEVSIE